MSTEHQQYSTENQSIAILRYAQLHGMEIVHTYADHGKSGLDLKKRSGLKQLLEDAVAPDVAYNAVLVYDVSRWGRFQNPDQGASYEYALSAANVPIHYCAEQFPNDGSISSALLKSLKRGMAGEYSRELSVKVWAGQQRLVQLGFRLGGMPGYGLRRHLLDQNRTFKQVLNAGDRKSLQSDRVILVPGPPSEVKIVRKIYQWFTQDCLSEKSIADKLNAKATPWIGGRLWNARVVREILANPKYMGSSVYNRKSFKLHKQMVYNRPDEWVSCPHAFEPLITSEQFASVQDILSSRSRTITTPQLVDSLKLLLKERGYLSSGLIDSHNQSFSQNAYRKRFGNLRKAYATVNFQTARNTRLAETDVVVRDVLRATEKLITAQLIRNGSSHTYVPKGWSGSFLLDDEFSIRVVPVRCSSTKGSGNRWFVQTRPETSADITVIVRLVQENTGILDYFILPKGVIPGRYLMLAVHNPLHLQIYRFPSLDFLERLTLRQEVRGVEKLIADLSPRRRKVATRLAALRSRNVDRISLLLQKSSSEPRLVSVSRLSFANQIDLLTKTTSLEHKALALSCFLTTLLVDEDFRTLMRAEKLLTIPGLSCVLNLFPVLKGRSRRSARQDSAIATFAHNNLKLIQLAESLPKDRDLIHSERLEDGKLCRVAACLIETYPLCPSALSTLMRVKPERQIEIAEQIVAHGNWSPGFLRVLMYATQSDLFIEPIKPRKKRHWSVSGTVEFAKQSDSLLEELKTLEPDLGQSFLVLATWQRYTFALLKNMEVRSYLARKHPEAMIALNHSEEASIWT